MSESYSCGTSSQDQEPELAWYGVQLPALDHKWVALVNFPNADASRPEYSVTLMYTDRKFGRFAVITSSFRQSSTVAPGLLWPGISDAVLGAALGLHSNIAPGSPESNAAFAYITQESMEKFDSSEAIVNVDGVSVGASMVRCGKSCIVSILLAEFEIGVAGYGIDPSHLEIWQVPNHDSYSRDRPPGFDRVVPA